MIFIVLSCDVCHDKAGIGMTVEHAEWDHRESGGRVIAGLRVCQRCARVTR